MIRVLFIGDVMGSPGRRAIVNLLGALRSDLDIHFAVVNGENAAGGLGITPSAAREIFDAGADVITLGNHAFTQRKVHDYLNDEPRIIRPANFPPGAPGRGWGVYKASTGQSVGVVNLIGRVFMQAVDCPFRAADAVLDDFHDQPDVVVVDMHAEATSEKIAMCWHLNGRAAAVIGTHTHVQTSDERVTQDGTACITDAGMTGVHDSVLGLDKDSVLNRFTTQMHTKFQLARGEALLQGVVVDCDPASGRASAIRRISVSESDEAPLE